MPRPRVHLNPREEKTNAHRRTPSSLSLLLRLAALLLGVTPNARCHTPFVYTVPFVSSELRYAISRSLSSKVSPSVSGTFHLKYATATTLRYLRARLPSAPADPPPSE